MNINVNFNRPNISFGGYIYGKSDNNKLVAIDSESILGIEELDGLNRTRVTCVGMDPIMFPVDYDDVLDAYSDANRYGSGKIEKKERHWYF